MLLLKHILVRKQGPLSQKTPPKRPVEETCRYVQQPETLHRTEAQAAALARLQSLQALYAAWPDAEHIARKEDCTVNGNVLDYTVTYTVAADICG